MAHLEDRGQGSRQRWRVRWRDPDGRHRARSFERKADGERFLHEIARRLDRGEYLDPHRGRVTLDEVAQQWWAVHAGLLATSTATRYGGITRGRMGADLGSLPVSAIDYATVAQWSASLTAAGLSGSSVRQHLVVLSQVLDHAVRDGRIASNPARLVRKPRVTPRRRHRYLDAVELDRLATCARWARPFVLTLGFCGLRWGEAAALRPEDLDPARGRLHIERSVTRTPQGLEYHPPKSRQRREVPAPDLVLEELARLDPVEGLVFTTPRGRPLHHTNFRRQVFQPALDAAGLPAMRLHELRHTAASLAVAAGADVLAVARMLGHDPAVTLRVYADLFDRDLDRVRERLDAVAREAQQAGGLVVLDQYRDAKHPATGG